MEEEKITVSNSTVNTKTESPKSDMVPQVTNMATNMIMENSHGGTVMGMMGKRKRGRPRKYDVNGYGYVAYSHSTGFSSTPSQFIPKRGRGRPSGSGNRQRFASLGGLMASTAGGNFWPHVITINTGENVAAKIISISLKGPLSICILSANGAVSNVTLRQPGSSGGILTYEAIFIVYLLAYVSHEQGRFEILSLTGSFTRSDTGGVSRTVGLSVSLAGPDGRVIGGGVAGLLIAASPIQLVLGSFVAKIRKTHKLKYHIEPSSASAVPSAPNVVTEARPISQVTHGDDTSVTPTSGIPRQIHGEEENSREAENSMNSDPNPNSSIHSVAWHGSQSTLNQTLSPDNNVSSLMNSI
ncbi:hypothetical protein HHK36_019276 [Tetracentron sinense]|uniref:AT-hook motif nuclear-localized protein n=1 Tax=Tetracentron sinense TaxID=13715 RepID=A0A834Z1Y9_TETSI|nr:hypothetical protein HHK36_019276 [Tetracentron sinense]